MFEIEEEHISAVGCAVKAKQAVSQFTTTPAKKNKIKRQNLHLLSMWDDPASQSKTSSAFRQLFTSTHFTMINRTVELLTK